MSTPATDIVTVDKAKAQSVEVVNRTKDLVGNLPNLRPHSPEWRQARAELSSIGSKDVQATSGASSQLLDRSVRDLKQGGKAEAKLTGTLVELSSTMGKLNPNKTGLQGFVAKLPFMGDGLEKYIMSFQSLQDNIKLNEQAIQEGITSLTSEKNALEIDREHTYNTLEKLAEHLAVAQKADEEIVEEIARLKADGNDAQATELERHMLPAARKRVHELMKHIALTQQHLGILHLNIENHQSLIENAESAADTTMAVLRNSLMAASVLATQREVKGAITTLDAAVNKMVLDTSVMVKDHTIEIGQQSLNSGVSLDTIKASITNVVEAYTEFNNIKATAVVERGRAIAELQTTLNDLGNKHSELGMGATDALLIGAGEVEAEDAETIEDAEVIETEDN